MNSSLSPAVKPDTLLKKIYAGIREDHDQNVFIPNKDNRPEPKAAVVTLCGVPILTYQNSSAIIAKPGAGKSSIIEAIAAGFINPNCDSLGFSVDQGCGEILWVDNERTDADVWNSYARKKRRSGMLETDEVENVTILGLRRVARLEERMAEIEKRLESGKFGLMLNDGAGDWVNDTNDLEQAIECRIRIRGLTVKYNISILSTLHPNPNTDKPRGHQGSEICREAECVLLVKKYDENTQIITSDFEHGKNRNNPKLSAAFRWSDQYKMFVSVDFKDIESDKSTAKGELSRNKAEQAIKRILPVPKSLPYTELCEQIMEAEGIGMPAAKKRVSAWSNDLKLISKHTDGNYRLCQV